MQKGKNFGFLKLYLIEFEIQTYSYFDLIHNHFSCMKEERKPFGYGKDLGEGFCHTKQEGIGVE